MCVVLVYSLTLRLSIFENFLLDSILLTKHHVIKACSTEKWKRCNRISSDITLGRKYPTAGYTFFNVIICIND